MGHNTEYIKRDKLEILLGILEIARSPVKKTHILYKANINFYQLTRYLDLLKGLDMLEEIDQPYKGYRTTEKGRQMLDLFKFEGPDIAMAKKEARARMSIEEMKQIQNL